MNGASLLTLGMDASTNHCIRQDFQSHLTDRKWIKHVSDTG